MPVFSYLAYPEKGSKQALYDALCALDYCEVTPAENEDVMILVTDTPDNDKEQELQEKFKAIPFLQSLGMTFGHQDT